MRCRKILLSKYENLNFNSSLIDENVDIIFCGSSFHYVKDWKEGLRQFSQRNPKIMIFSDIPAGDNEQFVTAQKYYDNRIPVRFFNIDVLSNQMMSRL